MQAGEKEGEGGGQADDVNDYDYTPINNLLQRNTLDRFRNGERHPLGRVLITGATGYLGIHILRELIDSDASEIYCLVRGKTLEAAESRLRTLLYYYFADAFKPLFGTRLHVVDGIIVGNLISEDGVSAINLSNPINQFIFTLHLLINAGAGMLVGYALGKGNIGEARRFFTLHHATHARFQLKKA